MPINASRNLEREEVDNFLSNGWFMGLGPERCLVAWGHSKKSKKASLNQIQFYVPDFYLEDKEPWVSFESSVICETAHLVSLLAEFADQPRLELRFAEPQLEDFEKNFLKIKFSIDKKEIKKAVPVVFATALGSMTKSMRAYFIRQTLLNANKQTAYGYFVPTSGILGASPEVLFSYDMNNSILETMALAGTRRSDREKVSSLSNDEKEMFEHELVIQGLKERLAGLGEMQVSPTYVWDLGFISHLRTDLTVELKEKQQPLSLFTEACQLLHPTAALGVAPVRADWKYLKSCDGAVRRGRFGAPFGVLSPEGKSIALVAIRNIQWCEDGSMMIGSGCGVVADSNLQNEWQELALKRRSIGELLGL